MKNFIRNATKINPKYPIHNCVPKHSPVQPEEVDLLRNFLDNHKKVLVVTGAGISTESGIPDYRSEDVGLYARTNHRPVQYKEFLKSDEVRKRYWARNYVGWPFFSTKQPNVTHNFIRELEKLGKIVGVVTQNVDGLHRKAGNSRVIELHGTAFKVICLTCGSISEREDLQEIMSTSNPDMISSTTHMIRPDGDVDIPLDKITTFVPPICHQCGGILKPDITFFGDNVPKVRVDSVRQWVSDSDSILVLGSSLSVFSGFRIILQGVEEGKIIVILNIGPTRADNYANIKLSVRCGDILPKLL